MSALPQPQDLTPPERPHAAPDNTLTENKKGTAAVTGIMRALTALLVPLNRGARRRRGKVAKLTTSSTVFSAALRSATNTARWADAHLKDVPVRVTAWSLPTQLLVMAVLTAGDYFGVNAILRAANLASRASVTLPLVITLTLLIGAKVFAGWDLSCVPPDADHPPVPANLIPALELTGKDPSLHLVRAETAPAGGQVAAEREPRSAAYLDNEARLNAAAGPVNVRKRAVLRIFGSLMAVALIGLIVGLGALGSQLAGGLGLNDGEHDGLLLLTTFGLTAGIVMLNVTAAFALAYGQYTPGAGNYRSAARNAQVKWAYVRLLAATAYAERASRRLVAILGARGEHAKVQASLGLHDGLGGQLTTDPNGSSTEATRAVEALNQAITDQTPQSLGKAYNESLDKLGLHLECNGRTMGPRGVSDTNSEAPGTPS